MESNKINETSEVTNFLTYSYPTEVEDQDRDRQSLERRGGPDER